MERMKKRNIICLLLAVLMLLACTACGGKTSTGDTAGTRTITDSKNRTVTIPDKVERVVCVGVGALRYSCYVGAADRVVGVEDYETKAGMSRLYNYVNFDKFPVVVVPGSDTTLDDAAYETIRLLGELYGLETRAQELAKYLKGIQTDFDTRTAGIPDAEKPTVYVGGVSFKGNHGFEGTEAGYGPFALIHASNLADTTGQTGAFNIDTEQVLAWDPDVIFLDFNGMPLINEDYQANPAFYNSLTAVRSGKVYSQISFRSSASNLETALADAYYAACVLYPEQFADIDPEAKAGEIFTELLGSNPYPDLKEAGYAFRAITLGE